MHAAKKNILVVENLSNGFMTFRLELIEALLKEYDVILSAPFSLEHQGFLEEKGCHCIDTHIDRRGTNPIKDAQLLFHYYSSLKKIKPDVILTYTIKPNIYCGIAASLLKIPYITTVNGLGTALFNPSTLQKILLQLFNYVFKHAFHVFLQNSAIKHFLHDAKVLSTANSSTVNGSGINLNKFQPLPYPKSEKPLRFLYVGRMMDDKGIPELMDAIKAVSKDYPQTEFHFIGMCEAGYKSRMQAWQDTHGIFYHGPQKNIQPFIAQSHCLVHPTHHEGMSNVCLEAAASARPIIASDIPGCRETFTEGVSGFGIEATNFASIEASLRKFIALPHNTKIQMGLAGRQKVEKEFDRTLVVQAYLSEIKKILKG